MKLKYLLYIFAFASVLFVMQSCLLDDHVTDYGDTPKLVQFVTPSNTANFIQGDGSATTEYALPITIIGGDNQPIGEDVTVTVEVAANSEAKEGTDFTFTNGKSVTIPAGELSTDLIITINKDEADPLDAKSLILEITSSDLTISESDQSITQLQAVCPIDLESFVGEYTVTDHVAGGATYTATVELDPSTPNTLVITNVWNGGGKAALLLSDDPVQPFITYNSQELGYVLLVHATYGDAWATTLGPELSTFNSCDNSMHLEFKLCVGAGCFGNEFNFDLVKN